MLILLDPILNKLTSKKFGMIQLLRNLIFLKLIIFHIDEFKNYWRK